MRVVKDIVFMSSEDMMFVEIMKDLFFQDVIHLLGIPGERMIVGGDEKGIPPGDYNPVIVTCAGKKSVFAQFDKIGFFLLVKMTKPFIRFLDTHQEKDRKQITRDRKIFPQPAC